MKIENMNLSDFQNEMINTLMDIVSIPSVKGAPSDGAPFGIETKKALDFILSKAGKMGFKTCELDGYAGYIEFGEGDKEIAILCHLDVVPAGVGWEFDPFSPFIKDGKIIGRGTNDDKGPAIAALYAMKALKDSGYIPPCRIRLILGLDEESGSQCMVYYKKSQALPNYGFTPDAKFPVIFAEKGILHVEIKGKRKINLKDTTTLNILVSIKGGERANMVPATCQVSFLENISASPESKECKTKQLDLSFNGRPGHASMPEMAENAISKAVMHLKAQFDRSNSNDLFIDFYSSCIGLTTDGSLLDINCMDDDFGALTCNVGLIDLTDESVSMTLDIRYPASIDKDFVINKIKNKCEKFNLDVSGFSNNNPLFVDKDSQFVKTLLNAYESVLNTKASPISIGGGTYARSMPNVVAFGPNFNKEDDVAHQSGEYIRVNDLILCSDIYQKAIKDLSSLCKL